MFYLIGHLGGFVYRGLGTADEVANIFGMT